MKHPNGEYKFRIRIYKDIVYEKMDQQWGKAILSLADWNKVKRIKPETGIKSINDPHSFNSNFKLRAPLISTINNFLYGGRR